MYASRVLLTTVSLIYVIPACAATECDFEKRVGSCRGTISIVKAGGAKPSFNAELRISTNAPHCSKVEYYLDSTPHQTILRGSSSETESVFGTKPITKSQISVSGCYTYEVKGGSKGAKYGACGNNAEARRILDKYDPNGTLAESLANIRRTNPIAKSMLAKTEGYRSDPQYYAANKSAIDREIRTLRERVEWGNSAIRVLESCD